jgi:enamine deaminase RidA (YjgF/YER057c/UK114 family)
LAHDPEAHLRELGHGLPEVPEPAGAYVPAIRVGSLVFTAGQLPFEDGELPRTGKVGDAVTLEEAREAARRCALNALAAAAAEAGGLDRLARIVKVTGYVASTPDFDRQPEVINGASDLIGGVFGEAGRDARSAVGVAVLPQDAPVEVELVAELGDP